MINNFDREYAFLSNFYNSPMIGFDGINYPTVEHAFQAQKTLNYKERLMIANALTPGKAKRLGRQVQLRDGWNNIKNEVMYNYVFHKFSQNPDLKQKLIDTNFEYLEEGNTWHDNYWGNCYCAKCQYIKGENHLGKILMQVRDELLK